MACFRLLHSGYVGTIWKSYAHTVRNRSFSISSNSTECDLHSDSHILSCLVITLILILFVLNVY